jgi:predicted O-methyltransferase YrrM
MSSETREVGSIPASPPQPANTLLQMMTSYWVAQAIYVAARLGLADHLAGGPMTCEDLAAATQSHAPSLRRLLRALVSVGVFAEPTPGRYALTPLAALLQSATPGSMRSLAIVYGDECYRAWGDFLHSIRSGEPAFAHHFGMAPFAYFAAHPAADRTFNEAMIGYTQRVADAVVAAYDFAPFGTVVDVGGGYGTILAAVLRGAPAARGVLFDQPHVVADARALLTAAGVAERCTCVGGDFFAAVPSGDAYILSQILHDWDDERCTAILAQCRRAMPEHGKLLVVELVLPPGAEPSFGKWLDLHMLAVTGGRERTADEFDRLFRAAAFALERVLPTPAGPSIVEAIPA